MPHNELFKQLAAPFPRDAVHWRAGNIARDGTKALALAYIDARDLMNRLDAVVGPENWRDSYRETPRGRVFCTLSLRLDGEWISKSDGAGETDFEGDKGGISDAFKRAGVRWGVGRYLYGLGNVWCKCECREAGKDNYGNTKWRFVKWTDDPWRYVKSGRATPDPDWTDPANEGLAAGVKGAAPPKDATPEQKAEEYTKAIIKQLWEVKTEQGVNGVWSRNEAVIDRLKNSYNDLYQSLLDATKARRDALKEPA